MQCSEHNSNLYTHDSKTNLVFINHNGYGNVLSKQKHMISEQVIKKSSLYKTWFIDDSNLE